MAHLSARPAVVLSQGGTLATVPEWRGSATELRLTVRVEAGRRVYDVREWYEDPETGDMRPGRKGISHLAGADLRALLAILTAAIPVIPRRGSPRLAAIAKRGAA